MPDTFSNPQLRLLGPKYGKQLGQISKALAEVDGSAAKKQLDTEGVLTITVNDGKIDLTPEELLITTTQKKDLYLRKIVGLQLC